MASTDGGGGAFAGAQHRVAIALGSNTGDRRGNIAAALQRLRALVAVERVSSVYETTPVGYADQPDFLNLACVGTTALQPKALRESLAKIERQLGRRLSVPLGPRAIDLDLLLYDDLVMDDPECTVPHHGLTTRGFVLIPLAEIAPALRDPVSGTTIAELAAAVDSSGVTRSEGGLLARISRDVQEGRPQVPLALNRAGITGVKTLIDVPAGAHGRQRVIATFDIFADLDAARSGVHMSRFSQDLEDALSELAAEHSADVATLALSLARRVVASQHAERAEVQLRAPFALPRTTPVSAKPTHEFYIAIGRAVASTSASRRLIGVEAEGMTACPCAQGMVADHSRERLLAEGFTEDQIVRILSSMPIATHNQRGLGTLLVGTEGNVELAALVEIVEQSMSAETYDLLKRPDELFVVNKAHAAPRFVEDVVREMLRYAHDAFDDLAGDTFVWGRQVNYESIHKHDAVAESGATLAELRRELAGQSGVRHTSLEQWLYAQSGVEAEAGSPR